MKTLFTKVERFLLRNNQVFVLNSSSSEQNHCSSEEDLKIEQLFRTSDVEKSAYYNALLK